MSHPDKRRQVNRLAGRLFATERGRLLALARRNCDRDADAEEALQEAFAAFIMSYDPERGSPPLPWLTLTLKRACWQRRAWREICVEPLDLAEAEVGESPDPAITIGAREEARRRLGALRRDQRQALVLHAAGYTYGEIGSRCGWTHTKVNRCLYEGRRELRGAR